MAFAETPVLGGADIFSFLAPFPAYVFGVLNMIALVAIGRQAILEAKARRAAHANAAEAISNDAGIVLPDADPAAIAEGLFWGAFINNGQTCATMKRLYVHASIYDAVCEHLVAFAKTIPVGDSQDEGAILGPIQNRMQFDKVSRLVEAANTKGRVMRRSSASLAKGWWCSL